MPFGKEGVEYGASKYVRGKNRFILIARDGVPVVEMKLLLNTHILLWALSDDAQLPEKNKKGSSLVCVGGIFCDSPAIPVVCDIFEEVMKEDRY